MPKPAKTPKPTRLKKAKILSGKKPREIVFEELSAKVIQGAIDKEDLAERKADFEKTIRKFKPKKKHLGRFVFLSKPSPFEISKAKKQGKPVPKVIEVPRDSRRKSYAVLVTKTGEIKAHLEPTRNWGRIELDKIIKKGKQKHGRNFKLTKEDKELAAIRAQHREVMNRAPQYVSPKYHDLLGGTLKKQFKKTFSVNVEPVFQKFDRKQNKPVQIVKNIEGGDWRKDITPAVAQELVKARAVFAKRAMDLVVTLLVVVIDESGREKTVEVIQKFQTAFDQKLDLQAFENYVDLRLYADFAEQLKGHGLVTMGSARYIRQHFGNRNRGENEWVQNAQGERWEKNECDLVEIVSAQVIIDRVI